MKKSMKNNGLDDNDLTISDVYKRQDISSFEELGGIFLEREINGQVNKIDIEKY